MLPDFIIIGAQKAGTTTLYENLCQHPKIDRCATDEAHYFDRTQYFYNEKPIKKHLDEYKDLFVREADDHLVFEKTPAYSAFPFIPARIHKVVPNIKLILSMRNPIDRAYSQYMMEIRVDNEHLPFKKALIEHENYKQYIGRGLYIRIINNFLKYFNRNQLLLLDFEDIKERPVYDKIWDFLGIDGCLLESRIESRIADPYPPMANNTREFLKKLYKEYNNKLFDFLGEDLGWND